MYISFGFYPLYAFSMVLFAYLLTF